jgi:hypothetical protein
MTATDLVYYGVFLGWSVLLFGVVRELVWWWSRASLTTEIEERREPTLELFRSTEVAAGSRPVQATSVETHVVETPPPTEQHRQLATSTVTEPRASEPSSLQSTDPADKPSKHLTADGRDKFKMSKQEYHAYLDSRMLTCSPTGDYPSSHAEYNSFRDSDEWRKAARAFRALLKEKNEPNRCSFPGCGATPVHIDHIRPVIRFWSKRLDLSNFQLMCNKHKWEKGNKIETDFRPEHWRRWFDN